MKGCKTRTICTYARKTQLFSTFWTYKAGVPNPGAVTHPWVSLWPIWNCATWVFGHCTCVRAARRARVAGWCMHAHVVGPCTRACSLTCTSGWLAHACVQLICTSDRHMHAISSTCTSGWLARACTPLDLHKWRSCSPLLPCQAAKQ